MAADERDASWATSVRVGRTWGPSRWGLIWPRPYTVSKDSPLPSHNGTAQQQTLHPQSGQMNMRGLPLHQTCPSLPGISERDPALTFRVCLMVRDGKVRPTEERKFLMFEDEQHSGKATHTSRLAESKLVNVNRPKQTNKKRLKSRTHRTVRW